MYLRVPYLNGMCRFVFTANLVQNYFVAVTVRYSVVKFGM